MVEKRPSCPQDGRDAANNGTQIGASSLAFRGHRKVEWAGRRGNEGGEVQSHISLLAVSPVPHGAIGVINAHSNPKIRISKRQFPLVKLLSANRPSSSKTGLCNPSPISGKISFHWFVLTIGEIHHMIHKSQIISLQEILGDVILGEDEVLYCLSSRLVGYPYSVSMVGAI